MVLVNKQHTSSADIRVGVISFYPTKNRENKEMY